MEKEIRMQMRNRFFQRGRWTSLAMLTLVYLFSLTASYPQKDKMAFYAGFLMFVHLLIIMTAKWIIKFGEYYALLAIQAVVSIGMAIIMGSEIGSFAFLVGTLGILVIENISLASTRPRHLISWLLWVYAGGVLIAGLLTNSLINCFYLLEAIMATSFLAYYYYNPIYENGYQSIQLQQLNDELNDAYQKVEQLTVVEERQKMARDLHDTLTQDLVGIGMELSVIEAYGKNGDYNKAKAQLQHTKKLTTSAISESRDIIEDYRNVTPADAAVSLRLRVLERVELLHVKYGLKTTVEIDDDVMLAGELLVDVTRMVNEALMNVIKHANILEAQVGAIVKGNRLIINVENNGDPFPENTHHQGHFGLLGMRERAQSHGGDIRIMSLPNEGTVVQIEVEMGQKK